MGPDLLVLLFGLLFGSVAFVGSSGAGSADGDAEDAPQENLDDQVADQPGSLLDEVDDPAAGDGPADEDPTIADPADEDVTDVELGNIISVDGDTTDSGGVRLQNALGEDATDFLGNGVIGIAPEDFDGFSRIGLQFLVDENVAPGDDPLLFNDELTGEVEPEATAFDIQFLSNDSGAQTFEDPEGDTYVIGAEGADDIRVTSGQVIANLGAGNDVYTHEGYEEEPGDTFLLDETGAQAPQLRGLEWTGEDYTVQNRIYASEGNDTVDVRAIGGFVYGGDGETKSL